MKKNIWLLAALTVCSAVCAQQTPQLGAEDMLRAFRTYNPAALEKAAADPVYGQILHELAQNYSAPSNPKEWYDLVGLVKNFDNSLRLELIRQNYLEGRTLQLMSGTSLAALDAQTRAQLVEILQSVFENTLAVKEIELSDFKQVFAQTHAAQLKAPIKALKKEIRDLKKNSKQKIQNTADVYLQKIQADFAAVQPQQLSAEQSAAWDVKANHKKPVAQ